MFEQRDRRDSAASDNAVSATANGRDARVQLRQLAGGGFDAQAASLSPVQAKQNDTGLPDEVKSGVEGLSGMSLDAVRVHYHSDKPTQMKAHAYTQGTDIHVAPGQEQHVAHEAWHVVQQAQGRVQGVQAKGIGPLNSDHGLEAEADVMGAKAAQLGQGGAVPQRAMTPVQRSSAGVIQMKPIEVSGGTFDTFDNGYLVSNGSFGKGCEMAMSFNANDSVGKDGDTVSLIQTVQDTTKRVDQGNDVTVAPTTSQLGNRTLKSGEEGVGQDEVGLGIDQEVLNDKGTAIKNVDPRYTEQRMDTQKEVDAKPNGYDPRSVRSAKKGLRQPNKWSHAALNDAPNVSTKLAGVAPKVRRATITGGMKFEVAALHNESGEFLGSVKWGWRMNGADAVLDPEQLTLVNAGSASARFFKAAAKWNGTEIVDPQGVKNETPMPVPVPTLESARRRVEAELDKYPKDVKATPLQESALHDLIATLKDVWNALKDDERKNGSGVVNTLDRYYLQVQHRRPSQSAMLDEQGFKAPPRG